MKIKELYQRFRAWQKDPIQYYRRMDKHVCANCGQEYEGSFCPICGQYYNVSGVDWSSVGKEIIKAWGIESGSFVSSLIQILGRPGYLISDYINGRRQICYSPISMLLVLAMIVTLILRFTGLDVSEETLSTNIDNDTLRQAISWLWSHLGWCMLFETLLLIIPTWLLFRYSPKHSHHTIPEGFYIQLFMGSLLLVFSTAAKAVDWLMWLVPIYYYFAYRQLFGYGIWSTLWRTALVLCEGLFIILFIAIIVASMAIKEEFEDKETMTIMIVFYIIIFAINVVVMHIGYRIGKKTAAKRLSKENA